jgi:hypothetical protein
MVRDSGIDLRGEKLGTNMYSMRIPANPAPTTITSKSGNIIGLVIRKM